MKLKPSSPTIQAKREPTDLKKKLKLVRAGEDIAKSLAEGDLEKAFHKTILSGIKLAAGENPFKDPTVNPLKLAAALKTFGIEVLGWTPETLFAAIDKRYNGWSDDRAKHALDKFHDTGIIDSDVPYLVRQKIYAIRIIATSDTAQNEWHIFEKVGSAFNDRTAKFGVIERLSAGECARTIAIIENIRPDEYSKEVQIYIAASAHEDGFLTVAPSKYLRMVEPILKEINAGEMGASYNPGIVAKISEKLKILQSESGKIQEVADDLITIQALKLMAIDHMGDESVAEA